MATGAGWYARNASRNYPLAGTASGVDVSGRSLPEMIIADMQLRFAGPRTARARLEYVAVASNTVSVIVASGGESIATATTSLDNLLLPGRQFPLVPLRPGVTGTIVFGNVRTSPTGEWRFDSDDQSELSLNAASPRNSFEAESRLYRSGQVALRSPEIRLLADGDLEVVQETRTLDGQSRAATVIRLASAAGREASLHYAGACGKRPESDSCGDPQPIERLGLAAADCCGRIFVEFRGCFELHELSNACGVVLNCPLDVRDVCPAPIGVPDAAGRLPSEEFDACNPETASASNQNLAPDKWNSLSPTTTTAAPTTPEPYDPNAYQRLPPSPWGTN